ncbi:hypothetical protein BU15DRAFT_66837 [Melanogaster broomeanus]|nr:hypothetical protein BU15DRAFT_66837 [Melanogaster broomeanus]
MWTVPRHPSRPLGGSIVVQAVLGGPPGKTSSEVPRTRSTQGGSVQVRNGVRVRDRDNTELEQSDLDGDNLDGDDDTLSKRHLRKYLEEKGLKKCRGDSTLPKSALPDSVREFNVTNDNPPTLSDLAIDWSSTQNELVGVAQTMH